MIWGWGPEFEEFEKLVVSEYKKNAPDLAKTRAAARLSLTTTKQDRKLLGLDCF